MIVTILYPTYYKIQDLYSQIQFYIIKLGLSIQLKIQYLNCQIQLLL